MNVVQAAQKVFLWSLGASDWVGPSDNDGCYRDMVSQKVRYPSERKKLFLSVMSVIFHSVLVLMSLFAAWWHVDCYYRGPSGVLIVASFVLFYWPILVASPVICIVASVRRHLGSESVERISWVASFTVQMSSYPSMSESSVPKVFTFVVFYTLSISSSILEMLYFMMHRSPGCKTWSAFLYAASNIGSMLFYCNFSYFLYLRRKSLEGECKRAVAFIGESIRNYEKCSCRAKEFFGSYYQLRKLVFPWLNVVLFVTAFGMTFFLSWKLLVQTDDIPATTPPPTKASDLFSSIQNDTLFCSQSCQQEYSREMRQGALFATLVLTEKAMMALLALHAVRGMDLKYQWDRFKMRMYLEITTAEDTRSWKQLSDLVERMNPDSSTDNIVGVIVPLVGIVAGFLTGQHVASHG